MTSERSVIEGIVPRWEWRAFAERFADAERRFAALSPERERIGDELYLLSLNSDASVKVRDGFMDIKALERVNGDGLEQWKPVMKAGFPLPAAEVRAVLESLGVTPPRLARPAYTLDQLVDELVTPDPDLLAVAVHKRRAHYTFGGCRAELSEVRTGEGVRQTISIESEDPDRVAAAVRELGLDPGAT